MPMTPNSSGRNDPSTSHASTPVQAGLTQPTVMSLDAATVNIFLAQSLFASDVPQTSLMSYAEGFLSFLHSFIFLSNLTMFFFQACVNFGC
jgi:hypothetical protein